ncbi:hypothetical protein FA95DRAFT_1566371 [Auriscalpium vulgare]|uniref:Uncharacterized protein n=1 Tax=Auriscalpium vulgare TaxID=40419 RepID=A0ACB8R8H0_9AGAM|nr:hypothetical protein FA95DRAFT_1566371 [Auriscalpium vulgare]
MCAPPCLQTCCLVCVSHAVPAIRPDSGSRPMVGRFRLRRCIVQLHCIPRALPQWASSARRGACLGSAQPAFASARCVR